MNAEKLLTGKVALVTGGGRGIGRACALRMARLGARVAVVDIRLDSAKEFGESLSELTVGDECRALHVNAIDVEANLTVCADAKRAVREAMRELGGLDLLINCAGEIPRPTGSSQASEMVEEDYRQLLAVNLSTTVFACQAAVIQMKEQRFGRIVNFNSQASVRVRGDGALAAYSVAKSAVSHYTRILAAEVGHFGIRVNAIAPGFVVTQRTMAQLGDSFAAWEKSVAARVPLRRLGTPDDIARVAEFLVTSQSDYITGQVIHVCGGGSLPGLCSS